MNSEKVIFKIFCLGLEPGSEVLFQGGVNF